ncbi:MAG: hypothetical protein PHU63_01590 [Candidatus ainarchaeum sp.]|nr:hypothetical protein [Candidatus ainarchaeum sp.]
MKGTSAKDFRKLSSKELDKKLEEMENAMLTEKKSTKLRPIKRAIARIRTIQHQIKNAESKKEVK